MKSLLASLGFSADIEVTETDGIVCLNISSPDSPYIIGGDGDRLDDLQYLVNRMIQRKMEDAPRVNVDCDPVSYTHLDVYKRQGCCFSGRWRNDTRKAVCTLPGTFL